MYLTNEVFLYRVAGVVGSGADEVVELEDCYGLDSVKVSAVDLHARRLRVVAPARDDGARLAKRLDHAAALGRTPLTSAMYRAADSAASSGEPPDWRAVM